MTCSLFSGGSITASEDIRMDNVEHEYMLHIIWGGGGDESGEEMYHNYRDLGRW